MRILKNFGMFAYVLGCLWIAVRKYELKTRHLMIGDGKGVMVPMEKTIMHGVVDVVVVAVVEVNFVAVVEVHFVAVV